MYRALTVLLLSVLAHAARAQSPVMKVLTFQASTVAALRAYAPTTMPSAAHLAGYTTDGDGGGGDYQWSGTSTATDDGCGVIKAAAVTTGRWLVVIPASGLDVRRCGLRDDSQSGGSDQAPAVNAATAYVSSLGGGTVSVPVGSYTLSSQIVVARRVRLQCQNNSTTYGSIGTAVFAGGVSFAVKWGSGVGSSNLAASAAVQLRATATIDGCGFTYPNQNYTSSTPTEYGATILAYDTTTNFGQTATHNFCYNCYSFLDFRGSVANAPVQIARVEYNFGAPIAYGFRLNYVNDWGHYDHNIFKAGEYDANDGSIWSHLPGWTIAHGIAFEIGNSDWVNLTDEQEWGYSVGVSIIFNGGFYNTAGPVWIVNSQFDACQYACILDAPSSADTGILNLRVTGNTLTPFDPTTNTQSAGGTGLALSINGNSSVKALMFANNVVFGPVNYVIVGTAIDVLITGNTTYPNVASSIAAAGPAFTLGNGTTAVITNNVLPGFNSTYSIGTFTNVVNTGNFVH